MVEGKDGSGLKVLMVVEFIPGRGVLPRDPLLVVGGRNSKTIVRDHRVKCTLTINPFSRLPTLLLV